MREKIIGKTIKDVSYDGVRVILTFTDDTTCEFADDYETLAVDGIYARYQDWE